MPTQPESADLFVKASIEKTDKGYSAVASTSVLDRQDEVIDQTGWDIKNYKKNPILQWAHDHSEPAIGTAKNVKVEGEGKKAKLVFEPVFHEHTPMAKALKAMVDDNILNSFSVGYKPIEMDGNVYTKQELLEISLVNVPANPEARMLAYKSMKKAGLDKETIEKLDIITTDDIKDADESDQDTEDDKEVTTEDEETKALKAEVQILKEELADVVKGLKHLNPQGRKSEVVTQRLALSKVAARAADKLLEQRPKGTQAKLLKVIKRANERLIVDHKQELKSHGKNSRPS